jgi:ribokinase
VVSRPADGQPSAGAGGQGGGGPAVVVVGSLNLDVVVPVPHHPVPGETVLGGDAVRAPGGKGANQAVAAARLGQRVAMVGCVGDDAAGEVLLRALDADGVDHSHVEALPGVPTGTALISVDPHGENAIVVSPSANSRLDRAAVDRAGDRLAAAAICLLQLEIPLEAVAHAAGLARGTVILNPAPGRPLPADLLTACDVLVPNRAELATLLGEPAPRALDEVAELARRVEGPRAVVVTLGAEGAMAVSGDGVLHVPAVRVDPVDTTAAGDCFCGALADALARRNPLERAVEWAVTAAALSTIRRGAQPSLPRRAEVEALAGARG